MVGVVHLRDPGGVAAELSALRERLLSDAYFSGVPSMQPAARKTALAFHAKDDVPEVRREVFRILPRFEAKVQVVVRRKERLAREAQDAYKRFGRKLSPNDLYDAMSARLFKNLLHKADQNHITFARRGKSDRADALERMIERAKSRFRQSWGQDHDRPTHARSANPHEEPGLQVIDYYLWALQRMFERGEDRYFNLLSDGYRLIMDLDDDRQRPYGEWYSRSNPLDVKKMKPVTD
jgi:hypothetical protein